MGSAASLMFYIVVFLLSVLFVYWGNREKAAKFTIILGKRRLVVNPLLLIGVAVPVLVAGFRQDVGTDFNDYVTEYNAATQAGSYLEISFNIISSVSNAMFGSPTFMFIVFAAMTVVPVMLAINKSTALNKECRWLYWLLFLFIMFPQTFNMLRQGVSVSIGFYLIVSIIAHRKFFKISHLVSLILAISFHSSAWLLVPLGFIARTLDNKSRKALLIFVVITGIVALASVSILPQLVQSLGGWSSYLDINLVSRSVVPRSLLILFILLICWKFYDVLKLSNSYTALLWVGLLFSAGGLSVAYFERAGYYVTLLLPLLVIVIVAQSVSRSQLTLAKTSAFVFALAYFIGVYYIMGSSDIFPYNWGV